MDLYTDNLSELADITAATLEERTTGEGVLRLEFAGFGPEWLSYMEPVTLYHKGEVIFHGKMVRVSRTNDGGAVTASAEVQNFFWLLERQTLGQQLAELAEAAGGSGSGSGSSSGGLDGATELGINVSAVMGRLAKGQIGKDAAQKITGGGWWVSWGGAVAEMQVSAPGWKALPGAGVYAVRTASAADDGLISVLCSEGVANRQQWATTEKVVTTASALWRMRRKAQDVQFIVDYAAGTVTAMGIGELPELVLDTSGGKVLSISDIRPQYEACCTGVVIAWTNDAGQSELHMFPEELDMAADGVKVFSLSGTYYVESWDTVAREYYEAASVLQYGGSVRVLATGLEVSPLGRRLNLVGPGTYESWRTMGAVVTGCSWDFLEGVVEVSLGRDFAEPEFADAAAVEDGGDYVEEYERNMSGEADGHWPFLTNEGSGSGGAGGGGSWGSASQEPKYVVEDVTGQYGATAAPGADGWVQSMYVYGVYSGQTDLEETFRQLMRFREEGEKVYLQVVVQKSGDNGSTWMPA